MGEGRRRQCERGGPDSVGGEEETVGMGGGDSGGGEVETVGEGRRRQWGREGGDSGGVEVETVGEGRRRQWGRGGADSEGGEETVREGRRRQWGGLVQRTSPPQASPTWLATSAWSPSELRCTQKTQHRSPTWS